MAILFHEYHNQDCNFKHNLVNYTLIVVLFVNMFEHMWKLGLTQDDFSLSISFILDIFLFFLGHSLNN